MSSGETVEAMSGAGFRRRVLAVAGCGVLTVTATACESTEQESAKLAGEDHLTTAREAKLNLGAANHSVRVSDVTLMSSSGRTAVAVRLTGTSTAAQVNVPLRVSVTGAGGKLLYSNAAGGQEPSLQRVALLAPGRAEWWVDDQVLVAKPASAAHISVGTGTAAPAGPIPVLSTSGVQLAHQDGLNVINGELVNHSSRTQNRVPVFAVALRAGKIVAAGRAVVETLPGGSTTPAPFQIFLVGNPAGASVELSAVPTAA
jgi:hypothetical protein